MRRQQPRLDILEGYPRELEDEQIIAEMKDIQRYLQAGGFDLNDVMQLTPVLQLGANELHSRNIERQAQISQKYADTSKRLSIISVVIAVTALIVAASTSFLSFRATEQDTLIQMQQLEALKTPTKPD